jgi:deazaflavin-dependent oxidoreductase (nitroreductase family)
MLQRVGRTRAAAAASRRIVPTLDGWVSRATGGRWRPTDVLFPTLVLEHVGRRSGRRFRTPLAYVRAPELGGAYVLAATNFGQAHHPAWSHNLKAATQACVVVKGERVHTSVRLATPEEKALVWPRLLEVWPGFADYDARSGREIRVFLLTPLATPSRRG